MCANKEKTNPMLTLPDKDLAIVTAILQQYIPQYTVWAFGSRVQGRVKPFSDLDLAIIGTEPISNALEMTLKHAFDESLLPIKVDIVDWQRITPTFQKIIKQKYHVIQSHEVAA